MFIDSYKKSTQIMPSCTSVQTTAVIENECVYQQTSMAGILC